MRKIFVAFWAILDEDMGDGVMKEVKFHGNDVLDIDEIDIGGFGEIVLDSIESITKIEDYLREKHGLEVCTITNWKAM